jgi:nucleoside-diphosphate-sugar epimerase
MVQLLEAGYKVRGTLRSMDKAGSIRQIAAEHTSHAENLALFEADLMDDRGWDEAMQGCTYVLHIASPFPGTIPDDENELIRPAVEGTRRVFEAAVRAGVKRVVQTSSVAAVASAHPDQNRTFTEADWSLLGGDIEPYPKSKTMAEQAAWEFINGLPEERPMELTVINPGYILGPVLDDRSRTSTLLLETLLKGSMPGIARLYYNIVDVRDVAAAHIAAMTTPEAAGKRFICVAWGVWLPEVANILAKEFGARGYKVPTMVLPDFLVKFKGLFDRVVRDNTKELGTAPQFDTSRIREILGWQPRPMEETIIEQGESMIEKGIV